MKILIYTSGDAVNGFGHVMRVVPVGGGNNAPVDAIGEARLEPDLPF